MPTFRCTSAGLSDRTVVMNTQAELQQAFWQMERGTFLTDDHSESRIPLPRGKKT